MISNFLVGGNDDPKNPVKRNNNTYQSQQDLDAANDEAKRFAIAHQLGIGASAYVGRNVGDPRVPYIDQQTGQDITGQQMKTQFPVGTIMDIRQMPPNITAQDIKWDNGPIPYFLNQDGDPQYIHPDIARSSRFVPTRGQYDVSIAKK